MLVPLAQWHIYIFICRVFEVVSYVLDILVEKALKTETIDTVDVTFLAPKTLIVTV